MFIISKIHFEYILLKEYFERINKLDIIWASSTRLKYTKEKFECCVVLSEN